MGMPRMALQGIAFSALLVAVACVSPPAPPPQRGAALHVATHGSDAWSGRLAAPNAARTDGPFATLTRAQQEVRKLRRAGRLARGVSVLVHGGTYVLTEPFTLGEEDSGTAEAPVVYRAAGSEEVVLTGSLAVSSFRPSRGGILQAGLKDTKLEGVAFRQLFFRGKRMVMARYPNVDAKDPHFGTWAHVVAPVRGHVKSRFRCTDDVVKAWTKVQHAQVCIHPAYGWGWNIIPIKSAHRDNATITLARNTSYDIHVGDRYFVQNLIEELDAQGEWHLDRDTATLRFWPPAAIREGDVRVPVTKTVVAMKGASHVSVEGFTIEACDGDAVRIADCESCRVARCTIRNCGGWGVAIAGGHRSGAVGNDIYATGSGGIVLSGGDRKTLARGDNVATNNYIHHVAAIHRTYRGGLLVRGVGNTASHNLIHDCYHQGIGLGGNDNTIEFNIVHHTNLGSEDTGGLYMSSRNYLSRGNVIRHNVFHHVGGFGKANSWRPVTNGRVKFQYPQFTWGIYLDAPETGCHVYGNVLYSVPICGLFNHSGKDNTWENNIIVDAPGFRASVWGRRKLFNTSWSHVRKAREEGYLDAYLQHYPDLRRYDEKETRPNTMFNCRFVRNILYYTPDGGNWLRTRNRTAWDGGQLVWTYRGHKDDFPEFAFDHNLVYTPPGIDAKFELTLLPGPRRLLSWDEWRATGKDPHSVFADPLFVDPASHDYRLRPDSPALKLGFKPIPFDRIGPYQDALRASWPIVEAPGAAALGDFTTERYFQLPGHKPVKAQELAPRGGLPRLRRKLAARQPVTIACFAGGNHAQGGWFQAFLDGLRKRHPGVEIRGVLAAIHGGARGSGFSVYRFRHEVLRHKPDLVFVDFAADDHEAGTERIWAAAEGVVRQAWRADPTIDLAFVYAFRVGYEKDYAKGLCPGAATAYERLADHYAIPSIDMGHRIAAMARAGTLVVRATADEAKKLAGKPVFTHDGIYTTSAAFGLYARIVGENLAKLIADAAAKPARSRADALAQPFGPEHLERARQIPITKTMLSGKWESREPGAFAQHFERIWFTNTPGAKLTFRFKGTDASIFHLIGPDTGRARVTIDGEDAGERQQVDRWCHFQRLSALPVASRLDDTEHTVTVELLPDPPDRSQPIAEAKRLGKFKAQDFQGVALRFGWIRAIGEAR